MTTMSAAYLFKILRTGREKPSIHEFRIFDSDLQNINNVCFKYIQDLLIIDYIVKNENYNGQDLNDLQDLKNFLFDTPIGVKYSYEIEQAYSRREIQHIIFPVRFLHRLYTIIEVEKIENCMGCHINSPKQYDHMNCPYGCLHMKEFCSNCTENYFSIESFEELQELLGTAEKLS